MTEGPRQSSPSGLLHSLCLKMREAGVRVDRSTLGAPILHPVAKSSFVFWDGETGTHERWFTYAPDQLEMLKASPIYKIYTRGEPSSLRLEQQDQRDLYPIGADLWAEGYYQYEALPLKFSDDTYKVLTLATKSSDGFSETDQRLIEAAVPALTLVFEGFIARNTARTLMETYVGQRAGLRVLDGEIARGDGSSIDAVIWFSDLRGFTALAQSRSESDVLKILNGYFGTVTEAIEDQSGEVLKFIGDAVLAIFPYEDDVHDAIARAEAAALKVVSSDAFQDDIKFGIGLHTGSVFYGNVGGGNRLDFTVIGNSVNVASRIEGLCSSLDTPILASANLASMSAKPWHSRGKHLLKGITEPFEVFALKV